MSSENVNEKAKQICKNICQNLEKQTELELEFLWNQTKFYKELLGIKDEEEPLKLFKKSHKKWLIERNEIERKLIESKKELEIIKKRINSKTKNQKRLL